MTCAIGLVLGHAVSASQLGSIKRPVRCTNEFPDILKIDTFAVSRHPHGDGDCNGRLVTDVVVRARESVHQPGADHTRPVGSTAGQR